MHFARSFPHFAPLNAGYGPIGLWGRGSSPRPHMAFVSASRNDARDEAGADRLVALANGEARLLLHSDRLLQFHRKRGGVARHHQFSVLERDGSGDVGGPEVELRAVVAGERPVTP